jgi:hypothetical protein
MTIGSLAVMGLEAARAEAKRALSKVMPSAQRVFQRLAALVYIGQYGSVGVASL